MNFNEKLQEILEKRGISKSQFSLYLSIGEERMDNFLSGKELPTATEAVKMSEFLQVSLDELLKTSYKKEEDKEIIEKYYLFSYESTIDDYSKSRIDYLKITKHDTLFRNIAALISMAIFIICFMISGSTLFWIIGLIVFFSHFYKKVKPKLDRLKILEDQVKGTVAKYTYYFYNDDFKVEVEQKGITNTYECHYSEILKVIETDDLYTVMKNNASFTIEKDKISNDNKKWLEEKLKLSLKEYVVKTKDKKKVLSKDEYVGIGYFLVTFIYLGFPIFLSIIKKYEHFKYLFIFGFLLIATLVLLFICKRRGGKVRFSVIAIIFGISYIISCFTLSALAFSVPDLVINDLAYFTELDEKIQPDFPKVKQVMVVNFERLIENANDYSYVFKKYGIIRLEDDKEFEEAFKNDSGVWTKNPENKNIYKQIPVIYSLPNDNVFYTVYIEETNMYNTMPNVSGTYNFIFISYNLETDTMTIMEFKLYVKSSGGSGI